MLSAFLAVQWPRSKHHHTYMRQVVLRPCLFSSCVSLIHFWTVRFSLYSTFISSLARRSIGCSFPCGYTLQLHSFISIVVDCWYFFFMWPRDIVDTLPKLHHQTRPSSESTSCLENDSLFYRINFLRWFTSHTMQWIPGSLTIAVSCLPTSPS